MVHSVCLLFGCAHCSNNLVLFGIKRIGTIHFCSWSNSCLAMLDRFPHIQFCFISTWSSLAVLGVLVPLSSCSCSLLLQNSALMLHGQKFTDGFICLTINSLWVLQRASIGNFEPLDIYMRQLETCLILHKAWVLEEQNIANHWTHYRNCGHMSCHHRNCTHSWNWGCTWHHRNHYHMSCNHRSHCAILGTPVICHATMRTAAILGTPIIIYFSICLSIGTTIIIHLSIRTVMVILLSIGTAIGTAIIIGLSIITTAIGLSIITTTISLSIATSVTCLSIGTAIVVGLGNHVYHISTFAPSSSFSVLQPQLWSINKHNSHLS